MTTAAIIFLVLLLALVGFAYVFSVRITGRAARERKCKQAHTSQLMLTLSPQYQQKVAADRAYKLQRAELHLKHAEFTLKRHLALHRIPAESYVINEEIGHLTAFPSLKHMPDKPLAPSQVAETELPSAPRFADVVGLISANSIPLTWTIDGPKMGTFRDLLSSGLIGRPERGKTTALLYYVCLLLMIQAEVWVWDLHGSMQSLRGLNYFDGFGSILESIPALTRELLERDELYHQKRFKHPIVLLVDELPALVGRYQTLDKRIRNVTPSPLDMARIFTLEARKWNGYTFLSGQSLPAEVLPTLTRNNLSSRIIFECSSLHARQMDLEKSAIDTLLPRLRGAPRGTHIADFSTWSAPELADIPYTDETDLQWILSRYRERQTADVPMSERGDSGAIWTPNSHSHQRNTGPLERGEVSLGESCESPVRAPGEPGESGGESLTSNVRNVRVSPEEKKLILDAARAQLREPGRTRIAIQKLIDTHNPPMNTRWWPKIKQVLDDEGL